MKKTGILAGMPVAGSLCGSCFAGQSPSKRKPDVLFIAIEDCAPFMGCYDHPIVKTPNIDSLAERGVLFERAYCQAALCGPSRASISTGLRPHTTGVFGNSTDWRRRIPKGMKAMPEFFRDNGYETVKCGKIHHHPRYFKDATPEAHEREDRMWHRQLRQKSKGIRRAGIRPKAPRPAWLEDDHYVARSLEWGPTGLNDTEQTDGAIAIAVAEALKQKRSKPLFMAVGFHSPHYSLRAPDKYFEMYRSEDMPLPENPPGDLDDVPHKYSVFNTTDDGWLSGNEKRQVLAAYYACISYVDTCVGILVEALKESGRIDNTIICLWGDHGMHMGEHYLYRKSTLFENAAGVPFMIIAPGVAKAGAVCGRPVELIDMYPTLADLCGLRIPDGLESISMKPLLRDPDRPWKKAAFTCQGSQNQSLRTQRWRYTEWGGPENAELYDHRNDPGEFANLANDPRHKKIVKELSDLLHEGYKAALPQ